MKGSDEYGKEAFHIDDEMVWGDIGGSREATNEGRLPEQNIEGVHLEGEGHDEEIVGELAPLIHSELHVEQSERECEVERGLNIRIASWVDPGPHEDAVEDNNEDLEDEDI